MRKRRRRPSRTCLAACWPTRDLERERAPPPHRPPPLPGTSLRYKPGFIHAGPGIEHDCGTSRGIGWFLEPLVAVCLFGKKPLSITLRGVTNSPQDPGVDVWRTVTLPLLRTLTGDEGETELRVIARGAPPNGGGAVHLRLPVVRQLPPISLLDEGEPPSSWGFGFEGSGRIVRAGGPGRGGVRGARPLPLPSTPARGSLRSGRMTRASRRCRRRRLASQAW